MSTGTGHDEPQFPAPPPPARRTRTRGRGRRSIMPATLVVVAALAAGGWYAAAQHGNDSGPAKASGLPPATATVTRQDLRQTQQEDGTLGYGTSYQLPAGRQGVLTWQPAAGATVTRGKPLYKADNQPVPLFYGSLPLYRTLQDGVADGPDVQELEQNLASLGYTGFTVDDHFDWNTEQAVEQWQSDNGLPTTGVIHPGDLIMLPGAIRVGQPATQTGATLAPGKPVYGYTGTTRTVTVALDVADQQLAESGQKVTVVLPDGTSTPGTVTGIGTVATAPSSSPGTTGSSGGSDATINVTVTLDDAGAAGHLDEAPVEVNFTSAQVKNVLTVPVAALLALSGGGYGVQVVQGDTSRIVAVTPGLFTDTRVQVSGTGLAAGMKVGVPSS